MAFEMEVRGKAKVEGLPEGSGFASEEEPLEVWEVVVEVGVGWRNRTWLWGHT